MKNLKIRFVFSVITLFSMLITFTTANAAPVKFNQVIQVINAKPGKAATSSFSQLRLVSGGVVASDEDGDKDGDKNKTVKPQQDDRVIIETTSEIVEDDVCDCDQLPAVDGKKFPYWTLLGLAAVPLLFLIPRDDDDTPTPTQTPMTPTTPTVTPTITPTITPTPPTTPTPTITPTPPETVPEPMTLILFGTGLASIGFSARKRFGKKSLKDDEKER